MAGLFGFAQYPTIAVFGDLLEILRPYLPRLFYFHRPKTIVGDVGKVNLLFRFDVESRVMPAIMGDQSGFNQPGRPFRIGNEYF